MVGKIEEKPIGNVDIHMMDAFNNFVANTELRELHRGGAQYT